MVVPSVTLPIMTSLSDVADQLESAGRDFAAMGPGLAAGEPWSLADEFGTAPEASWGPPEVLAHVSEMLPYWLGEIERIVAAPADAADAGGPVPFGRISDDPVRIAIIGRDRTIPLRELLARIAADGRRVAARLRELDQAGEDVRTGLHPRLGVMQLPDIAQRFLAAHAGEHVQQMREILGASAA
jgi:hypothetical protein